MRVFFHEFAGHSFLLQLSRELAQRDLVLRHAYSAELDTPQGDMSPREDDPEGFSIHAVRVGGFHKKHQLLKRFAFERSYARELIRQAEAFGPDVLVTAQAPSLVLSPLANWAKARGVPWVNYVQDLYGYAAHRVLRKKLPVVGEAVGRYFLGLDKAAYRQADASIVITDDFRRMIGGWGVDDATIHTLPNWAPLEHLPQRSRENAWSAKQGLAGESTDGVVRFVYSGTLSMKHNPALLLALGEWLQESGAGVLLVSSQGAAVDWLRAQAEAKRLSTIRCLGFQPYPELPDVLGAADVLVAVLEPDASAFSVPSKVLSYFCAGRALLAAIPAENLAAKTILQAGAGEVVEPSGAEAFVAAAKRLADSATARQTAADSGRAYAEATFDIHRIGDGVESILRGVAGGAASASAEVASPKSA
ncbi:MAG: glycosyltransferase family 4 protein [Planctomycetota bacterium]